MILNTTIVSDFCKLINLPSDISNDNESIYYNEFYQLVSEYKEFMNNYDNTNNEKVLEKEKKETDLKKKMNLFFFLDSVKKIKLLGNMRFVSSLYGFTILEFYSFDQQYNIMVISDQSDYYDPNNSNSKLLAICELLLNSDKNNKSHAKIYSMTNNKDTKNKKDVKPLDEIKLDTQYQIESDMINVLKLLKEDYDLLPKNLKTVPLIWNILMTSPKKFDINSLTSSIHFD